MRHPIQSPAAQMFQSTPAITGERAWGSDKEYGLKWLFQSTPAITGERAASRMAPCGLGARFNPRPPLLASEPDTTALVEEYDNVSIHARHYWRASRREAAHRVGHRAFQSRPAITGERADGGRKGAAVRWGFNPRPPLLASEPNG